MADLIEIKYEVSFAAESDTAEAIRARACELIKDGDECGLSDDALDEMDFHEVGGSPGTWAFSILADAYSDWGGSDEAFLEKISESFPGTAFASRQTSESWS